ncbi:MAG: hypothetical protein DMF34_02395 [Verrucomicrobia bacterium]|nr:MAG: hypothetical protein DMF34_02395 [Verrucomicrobiota bacterium]
MPKSVPRKKRRELRGRALVVATPKFKIQFAEPVARRWLKEFFGRPARAGLLPRKVCRWLAQHDRIKLSRSLVARQGDTRLYLKRQNSYVPRTVSLLLELIRGRGKEWCRWHRALTRREREVLFWVARGKSNAEIAAILGIKPATVGKHLERIYPKLGVENRTAAISFDSED